MPQGVRIDGLEEIRPLMTCIVLNWISLAVPIAGLKRLYVVYMIVIEKELNVRLIEVPCDVLLEDD